MAAAEAFLAAIVAWCHYPLLSRVIAALAAALHA